MEYDWYFWGAILAVISIILVIFCIVRGKGTSHKILIFFTSLLCVVAMVCFGGEVVLNHFGMGWRCTPFNTMVGLCFVLFIPILLCSIWQLIHLEGRNHTLIGCGVISMLFALVVIPMCSLIYFFDTSLNDYFNEYEGQTIVVASNGHGSSPSVRRYYLPINDLVHGVEILREDSWLGNPPHYFNP